MFLRPSVLFAVWRLVISGCRRAVYFFPGVTAITCAWHLLPQAFFKRKRVAREWHRKAAWFNFTQPDDKRDIILSEGTLHKSQCRDTATRHRFGSAAVLFFSPERRLVVGHMGLVLRTAVLGLYQSIIAAGNLDNQKSLRTFCSLKSWESSGELALGNRSPLELRNRLKHAKYVWNVVSVSL